nr:ABC transporter substrate-binding protein [Frankia sp. EI5c]
MSAGDTTIELDVARATATWLNEHGSGIGGRPIELVTCEAKGDPGTGTDYGNRMIEEDVVAVAIGHTAVDGRPATERPTRSIRRCVSVVVWSRR